MKHHHYNTKVSWEGNLGRDTEGYTVYSRDHLITAPYKYGPVKGSSDPSFLGNKEHYNPEELFLASLSSCHMLWYLHLCSEHRIRVVTYIDNAWGSMQEKADGSGSFSRVILRPRVVIRKEENKNLASQLHAIAAKSCFIANSCNFPVEHEPETLVLTNPGE